MTRLATRTGVHDGAHTRSEQLLRRAKQSVAGADSSTMRSLPYHPPASAICKLRQRGLQTLIENGDTLSFMGVFPGTGTPH
jgi:hypothetical protein